MSLITDLGVSIRHRATILFDWLDDQPWWVRDIWGIACLAALGFLAPMLWLMKVGHLVITSVVLLVGVLSLSNLKWGPVSFIAAAGLTWAFFYEYPFAAAMVTVAALFIAASLTLPTKPSKVAPASSTLTTMVRSVDRTTNEDRPRTAARQSDKGGEDKPRRLVSMRPNSVYPHHSGPLRAVPVSRFVQQVFDELLLRLNSQATLSFAEAVNRASLKGETYWTMVPSARNWGDEMVIEGVDVYFVEPSGSPDGNFRGWSAMVISGGFGDEVRDDDDLEPHHAAKRLSERRFCRTDKRPYTSSVDWLLGAIAGRSLSELQKHS
jgi:hypothetical protein